MTGPKKSNQITPIELVLTSTDGKRNIMFASLENVPFRIIQDVPPEWVKTTYLRDKEGAYYSPTDSAGKAYGTQQIDIINEMQANLKRMAKNDPTLKNSDSAVLIVKGEGKKDHVLNYKKAETYLADLKTLHLSRGHVTTEMQDIITYASKVEGIDRKDNLRIKEFAEIHKLKLEYKDVGDRATISIQDQTNPKIKQEVKNLNIKTTDVAVIGY